MKRYFRISVHKPLESEPMWASGIPSSLKVVDTVRRSSKYSAESVPAVILNLQQASPKGTVVTVY